MAVGTDDRWRRRQDAARHVASKEHGSRPHPLLWSDRGWGTVDVMASSASAFLFFFNIVFMWSRKCIEFEVPADMIDRAYVRESRSLILDTD